MNSNAGLPFMIRSKIGKLLAKSAPHYKLRILGTKLCGFTVGKKVYIGPDLLIISMNSEKNCSLIIEERVAIAPRVTLVLSSDANWSRLMTVFKPIRGKILLESDCWIGAGAIILPNVTIGKYSIVAAGSVVTKDVKPFTMVGGVPAKHIKDINYDSSI